MPLTTRFLALQGSVAVSPLFREILRGLLRCFAGEIVGFPDSDRMAIYEMRNQLYLHALAQPQRCFDTIKGCVLSWLEEHQVSAELQDQVLVLLQLDELLCPRTGGESTTTHRFKFDAAALHESLNAMELPAAGSFGNCDLSVNIYHPGGVGEILFDADGGSWIKGVVQTRQMVADSTVTQRATEEIAYVAIA